MRHSSVAHLIRNRRVAYQVRGEAVQIEREIVLPASPAEVWEALTEPERLEEWFATEVELDAQPGGEGVFRWGGGDERRGGGGRGGGGGGRPRGRAGGAARARLGGRRPGGARARGGRRRHARAGRRALPGMEHGTRAAPACVGPGRVAHIFDALGDPSRRSLVEAVASRGSATATELAAELPVTR